MAIATVKKFTIEDYHRLTELGFFQENDRVELIRGEIIEMAAKGRMHETCLRKLLRELSHLIREKATLQCQSPILLLPNSEPEPDFPYQKLQGEFGYLRKLIYLPNQSVNLPYFPDSTLDLSKVFPPKTN
jgi:Uma2 family endonuclease